MPRGCQVLSVGCGKRGPEFVLRHPKSLDDCIAVVDLRFYSDLSNTIDSNYRFCNDRERNGRLIKWHTIEMHTPDCVRFQRKRYRGCDCVERGLRARNLRIGSLDS